MRSRTKACLIYTLKSNPNPSDPITRAWVWIKVVQGILYLSNYRKRRGAPRLSREGVLEGQLDWEMNISNLTWNLSSRKERVIGLKDEYGKRLIKMCRVEPWNTSVSSEIWYLNLCCLFLRSPTLQFQQFKGRNSDKALGFATGYLNCNSRLHFWSGAFGWSR